MARKSARSYLSIEDILDKNVRAEQIGNSNVLISVKTHHRTTVQNTPPLPKDVPSEENALNLLQKQSTAADVSCFFAPVKFDTQTKLDSPPSTFGARKGFFPWNSLDSSGNNSQAIINIQRKNKREMNSRRQRTSFTADQTIKLELEFQINEYITRSRRFELADILGLSENQIKIWYQNRRAKDKRIEKAHLESHLRRQLSHLSALNVAMLSSATSGGSLYPSAGTGAGVGVGVGVVARSSEGLTIPGKEAVDAVIAVEKYIAERAYAHQSHAPKTTVCSNGLFDSQLFVQQPSVENSFSLF